MKILFIYSTNNNITTYKRYSSSYKKPLDSYRDISAGISILSAVLKEQGYKTDLAVLNRKTPLFFLDEIIESFKPDIIAFSAVASEFDYIKSIGTHVRDTYPNIFRIIGGVHNSIFPDESVLDIFIALCIGEGEYPLLELVQSIEKNIYPSGIKNIWIKTVDNKIEKNPCRDFIEDIDSLPIMDREIWAKWINPKHKKSAFILLGRGCPFNCTYCSNHALRRISNGNYVRLRSPESIIKELKELNTMHPRFKDIYFEIETFGADLSWSLDLCKELQKYNNGLNLVFSVNLRATPALKDKAEFLFSEMHKAGFVYINIGIESGSPKLRENILKRNHSNEDICYFIKVAKKHHIDTHLNIIIGLPEETIEDYNMTVDFIRESHAASNGPGIFYPYPGTDLYDKCKEKNLLPFGIKTISERTEAIIDYPQFSKKQIQKAYIWFSYYCQEGLIAKADLAKILFDVYLSIYGNNNSLKKLLIPYFFLCDILDPKRVLRPESNEKSITGLFIWNYIKTWWKDTKLIPI